MLLDCLAGLGGVGDTKKHWENQKILNVLWCRRWLVERGDLWLCPDQRQLQLCPLIQCSCNCWYSSLFIILIIVVSCMHVVCLPTISFIYLFMIMITLNTFQDISYGTSDNVMTLLCQCLWLMALFIPMTLLRTHLSVWCWYIYIDEEKNYHTNATGIADKLSF